MKMKRKNIIKLAEKIMKYEEEIRLGKNVQANKDNIENIIMSLTNIEDVFELDECIMSKLVKNN